MSDNIPGAPNEPQKPKEISKKISFSYLDLVFDDAFISDNRKFVRYFINKEEAFYVEMLQLEFLQYQQLYFDAVSNCNEDTQCSCDEVSPHYEFLGEEKVILKIENTETKEITEEEIIHPVYYIYDIPNSFKFGLHKSHDNFTFNPN